MYTAGLRFLVLTLAVCLIGSIALVQAQGAFSNGIVVAFMADSPYHHPLVVGQVPSSRTASQKGGPC